ncbi:MAG: hypothetical protein AB7W59_28805 [Acidimicrobiia bacterium]
MNVGGEIIISVTGHLPPAKGEAKSMLADGHPHRARVVALLSAAELIMEHREPVAGPVGMELVVCAPRSLNMNDATNLLGGVADVLQARSTGADVTHLGSLATVACYGDDAQIEQITYRRTDGPTIGYTVRLWPLG